MSKINDGGPAFPAVLGPVTEPGSGMSLRDWFAGQVIQGVLRPASTAFRLDWHELAGWAYGLADALLAERAKERT